MSMLTKEQVRGRVWGLLQDVPASGFGSGALLAVFLGGSYEMLRQWRSRGASNTVFARLVAEASVVGLNRWITMIEERPRLHDERTGALKPIWAVGLVEDIGVNPARVRSWAKDEVASAEERLAVVVCMARENEWVRRYQTMLAEEGRNARVGEITEEHEGLLKWARMRRIQLNYTQEELAERIGCRAGTVKDWENGRRGWSWRYGKATAALKTYCALLERLERNPKERTPRSEPRTLRKDSKLGHNAPMGRPEYEAEAAAARIEGRVRE